MAGALKWRVRIEKPAASSGFVRDANGFEVVGTRSANIRHLRGDETVVGDVRESFAMRKITLRDEYALQAIAPGWRLIDTRRASDVYEVVSVDHGDGNLKGVFLLCILRNEGVS